MRAPNGAPITGRTGAIRMLLTVAVVALAAAAVTTAVVHHSGQSTMPSAATGPLDAAGSAVLNARDSAITTVLDDRAAAVRTHDTAAFLATDDPDSPAFLTTQRREIANMRPLGFAAVSYTLSPPLSAGQLAATPGAPVQFAATVTMRYQLAGFDVYPESLNDVYTFIERDGQWRVADDLTANADGPTDTEMWDYGPLVVYRDADVLVIAHPATAALARTVADILTAAVPVVTGVWGSDWPQKAVVELPATEAEMSALIHETGLGQIAATESSELADGSGRQTLAATRITVNPVAFAELSRVGAQVVLTHEITHVASSAFTTSASPLWLVEGLANYVGFLHSGLAPPAIASELVADIHAGHSPTALPTNAAFTATNPDLAATYEQAWLACQTIAARVGPTGLVRLYRLVGASHHPSAQAVATAFHTVLHENVATFTAQWLTTVHQVAA